MGKAAGGAIRLAKGAAGLVAEDGWAEDPFPGVLIGMLANATPMVSDDCHVLYGMSCGAYGALQTAPGTCMASQYCWAPRTPQGGKAPGDGQAPKGGPKSGPGSSNRCEISCGRRRVVPPPPPIDQNPNNGPHPKTAPDRPAAKADVATDSQWQKGDSVAGTFGTAFLQALLDGFGVAFNPSLSDDDSSALSDGDGSGCPGGMLGLQCTASGNLLDPTTGTVYCNPAVGLTPGNTCVPLPGGTSGSSSTGAGAKQCGDAYHDSAGRAQSAVRSGDCGLTIDEGKWDYFFGRVNSSPHNAERSAQNAYQLESIGIRDNVAGREILAGFFGEAARDGVVESYVNPKSGLTNIRTESLLYGPSGALLIRANFEVTENGMRLTTMIPIGGRGYGK
jgi:filamentous hemagglutinin